MNKASEPKLKIKYVNTADLVPYATNARIHSDNQIAQIAASMEEFGFTNPVLVGENGGIIAGHGRVQAAESLGMVKVPTIILAGTSDGLTDEDEVPEAPETAVTKLGDIWLLGSHRLMCGDATDQAAVEALMDGHKADMVFTDPPYNADYSSRVDKDRRKPWGGILNDNMSDDEFNNFLLDINSVFLQIMVVGGSIYECIDWKHYPQMAGIFSDAFEQKAMIVWNKNYFGLGTYYRTKHEIILFGVKGDKLNVWNAAHDEMDVWDISRETVSNYKHPTQKPVELVQRAVGNSSKTGGMVVDLFGGSGSTLIACEKTGRQCRTMELDPKYCDVIVKRWENFTGLKAELSDTKIAAAM